jgi:outer membrane protein assembly factor BamB
MNVREMIRVACVILAASFAMQCHSQEDTRWRGPSGNGVYPETGLMERWPDGGPEVLWTCGGLGQGFSSAVVSGEFIYTTGMIDGTGYLFKVGMYGDLVYKKPYGPEFTESWYGTRGSPVVAGDKVYVVSGNGKLVCFHRNDGRILWSKELFRDFDGKNIEWGMNETVAVDGDILYVTPGGRNNNVVALNRHTGGLVWSSRGLGELSAYCSPLLFEHNGRKILATHTASHLIGLDASSGKLLWSQSQPNEWSVHANTPIYHNGELFYFSGYGRGGGKLRLSQDGSSATLVWKHNTLDSRIGGAVLVDGYLYGSGDQHCEWRCLDWETGKEMYASGEVGKGNVISADGMLYCYSERGELALVKATPEGFELAGRTRVTEGNAQHWAHLTIHNGVLYVRHGDTLIAYKVKKT